MRRTQPTRLAGGLVAGLAVIALAGSVGPLSPASGEPRLPVAAPAPATAFAAQPVAFHRCRDRFTRVGGAQCGLLTVPLDPADPTGPTIQVGVSRVLHTKEPYRGAVFTNAGGPGTSGTFLAGFGYNVPGDVGLTYDWYGLDPRGIGSSRPRISCAPHYPGRADRPSYRPSTPGVLRYWKHAVKGYAAACGSSASAALLAHDTTADTVADYEALRTSIGADQVTFYGASYGSYVGEVYATVHPDRVRAMVLDGVIGPAGAWYQANLDQNIAFQKPFERFVAWMGQHSDVFHVGRGAQQVQRAYRTLHRQLTRHPAAHGTFGPDELDDALQPAVYYNLTWPTVARAFSAMVNAHDPRLLVKSWHGVDPPGDDNGYAGYLATECTDAPWPSDWATWAHDARRTARKGPLESWANTWFDAPCRTWPFPASPQIPVSGASYTGPVLMTEQSLDPATPYAGALAARALFPTSRIVVGVGGTSHAVALHGDRCIDDRVADVLRDGSLPTRKPGNRPDVSCPGFPPPSPRQPHLPSDIRVGS